MAGIAAGLALLASSAVAQGQTGTLAADAWGCRSPDVLDRIAKILNSGDKAAFAVIMRQAYRARECADLVNGAIVHIEERSAWYGRSKVRMQGAIDSWWINSALVK